MTYDPVWNGEGRNAQQGFKASDEELISFMKRFQYRWAFRLHTWNRDHPSNYIDIMIQQQQLIDKLEERCNSLEEKIDGLQSNKRSRAPPRGNLDTRRSIS